jgi:hypothetical protein
VNFVGNVIPPDASYSYTLTPKNRVGVVGTLYGGPGTIYTLPVITSATFGLPSSSSIPILVNGTGTTITINRTDPTTVNTKSYDVSFASVIYDNSVNFVGSVIPNGVTYTYTLTPKNRAGVPGALFSGLGQAYTLPVIVSALYQRPTYQTIPIDISSSAGLCNVVTLTRYSAGAFDVSYDLLYATTIYDVSGKFAGNTIPYNAAYSYKLSPKNYTGVYGADVSLGTIYTLPNIALALYQTPTFQTIPIDVSSSAGMCNNIVLNRYKLGVLDSSVTVPYTSTIYDVSGNFSGQAIPYNTAYTYTLSPLNAYGLSGTLYTVPGSIYTLPKITGALYQTPTYQTIPIDISSSTGLTSTITVTRYLADGGVDTSFDVSYASTIFDISGRFSGNSIPYNTAYTYKLSPKNPAGIYGVDVSLSTIYTLPLIVSAGYLVPTTQTIPIDVSSSVASCNSILVRRYKPGNVLDAFFTVSSASTIYDVSGNFTGSVVPSDVSYSYTLTPFNVYGISGTIYTGLGTIYTLPTLTSATYGTITGTSIQITGIVGKYEYINITRNVLDNNNIVVASVPVALQITSPTVTSITDNSGGNGLLANSNYSYTLYAYNGTGQWVSYTMDNKYTYAQGTVGTVVATTTSATITWSGKYSGVTITRNDTGGSFTGTAYYPTCVFPQNTVSGSAIDTAVIGGTSYTYTISMTNVQGASVTIGSLTMTPSSGLSSATYGTITSSSIYLTGFTGSYSNIILTRYKGGGASAVFDTSYVIYAPDTSRNDTGLLPNSSYTYSLLPFNGIGVSGTYYYINNSFPIYTLPTLTGVVYSASANAINFTSTTGSYNNISVTRYSGTTSQATFNITSLPTSDTGLTSDTSYSYQFVPYGSGSISLSGSIVNVPTTGVIYTLPGIASASFGLPTPTQIPINVSATCTTITIGRFDPNGINTSSRDVSNASVIYDNSINFVGNVIPPDASYNYTLTPKNSLGVVGTPFSVGTVFTIPTIYSATASALDISSLQIVVTGSFESMLVNRYVGTIFVNSNTYAKSQFPLTDSNLNTNTAYNYSLLPFNGSVPSISGNYYPITATYTYGNISSAIIATVNYNTLSINGITGYYNGVYYQRTGAGQTVNSAISTPVTSFTDPSALIPDTSYTYVLSAINGGGFTNTNANSKFTVSTYTDASGYITSITDTSSSVTIYWSGYYTSATLTNASVPLTVYNASNTTSPADGTLVNGYATDNSGGVGLTANKAYFYQLIFTNKNGRTVTTPAILTYTLAYYGNAYISDTSSSVTLNWTGYYSSIGTVYLNGNVVVPDTSTNTFPTNTSSINSGSVTVTTGILPNNLYSYDVSLVNQAGVELKIAKQSAYTLAYYSSATIVALSSSSLQMSWTGYYSSITPVYQNTILVTPDTSSNTVLAQANWATLTTGSITKTGLASNTLYNYDVSLNNGNSVVTGIARRSAYTLASYSSVSIVSTATTITVSWTGIYSSITTVYRGTTGSSIVITPDTSTNTVLAQANWASTTSGSITQNTGLLYNTAYYYDLSLNNGNGVPTGIARKSIYTSAYGSSSAPTPVDTGSITVNWSGYYSSAVVTSTVGTIASTGTNYPNSGTPQATVNGSVSNTGLTSNTKYTYNIVLYNGNVTGTSLTSQDAYTYPAAPTSLAISAATVTDKTLTLTFISSSPGAGSLTYILSGTNYGTIGTVTNTSGSNYSVPISLLTSNSSYSIQIKGKNTTSTLESSLSTAITGNTLPSAPAFSAAAGVTSTTLSITKPSGTISAYYFSGGDSGTALGTPGSYTDNITTASLSPLIQNKSYTFQLSCKNNITGLVSASGSLAFITDAAAPTSVVATTGSTNSTTLKWTDPAGTFTSSNYSITGGGTVGTKLNTGTTINDLTPNTPYTFSVTVTGLSGNPSAAGSTSNFYTNPDKPTGLSATAGTTSSTLTFTAPSGNITSYTWTGTTGLTIGTFAPLGTPISDMTPNNTYSFAFTATNSTSGLTSSSSDAYSFTTNPSGTSSACTEAAQTSIKINWTGYYTSVSILRTTTNGGTGGDGISAGTSSNYTSSSTPGSSVTGYVVDNGVSAGNTYYYNITLTGANGNTLPLTQQSASTPAAIPTSITGGTVITITGYTSAYKFTSTGSSATVVFSTNKSCAILLVGGGGSGGATYNTQTGGGGGGGGGVLYGTYTFTRGTTYTLTIGAGGSAVTNTGNTGSIGNRGDSTKINDGTSDILVAPGGGGGGGGTYVNAQSSFNGLSGGCGGGAAFNGTGGSGNTGFTTGGLSSAYGAGSNCSSANPQYNTNGGGGGGAGNNGARTGVGGNGYTWSVDNNTYGGGGGGGAAILNSTGGKGGTGGGGAGDGGVVDDPPNPTTATSGTPGLGGGGGGNCGGGAAVGWKSRSTSGSGGSGIIIIAYN